MNLKYVNFESKSSKLGEKVVGFSKNSFDDLRGDVDQPFSRGKIWIRTACASTLGIVGEVYSELQGLQVWVVGQKTCFSK